MLKLFEFNKLFTLIPYTAYRLHCISSYLLLSFYVIRCAGASHTPSFFYKTFLVIIYFLHNRNGYVLSYNQIPKKNLKYNANDAEKENKVRYVDLCTNDTGECTYRL